MAVRDSILHRFTYEDYLRFPDDGNRYELIEGERFVTPAPSLKHQIVSMNLSYFLADFLRHNPHGRIFAAPCEVYLSREDVVQPDLLYVSNERAGRLTEKNVTGAPDLVVEILSDSTRRTDATRKLRLYERWGVREYWLIDPKRETARIHHRDGERLVFARELAAAAGDHLETPLLPGLAIQLDEVFR
jgi:Uma2 family endonuclease